MKNANAVMLVAVMAIAWAARGGALEAAWKPGVKAYETDARTALLLHLDASAEDASARENEVTVQGARWIEDGVIGQALRCDGKQKIAASGLSGKDLADGFTVEMWLRLKRPSEHKVVQLLRWDRAFTCSLYAYPDNSAKILIGITTDRGAFMAKTSECVPYRRWMHVACTYDPRAQGKNALSVSLCGVRRKAYHRLDEASGRLAAGRGPLRIAKGFVGDVDELRVSTSPRTAKELIAPWPGGRSGDLKPFVPVYTAPPRPTKWNPEWLWLTAAEAVPTFNSIGLYVKYSGALNADTRCSVRYRKKGTQAWRRGMDLVPAPGDSEFRGSLLMLDPGTTYQIEVQSVDSRAKAHTGPLPTHTFAVKTWDEEVRIGEIRRLPAGISNQPLVIMARGKPNAWILYAPPKGGTSIVDAGTRAKQAILFRDAAYVILERATIRGGARHCIRTLDSHHVRIRRCEMTGWGTRGIMGPAPAYKYLDKDGRGVNRQAGVRIAAGCSHVVVEDNYIHAPRGTANSWRYGHPKGPQAVILGFSEGNNVIRRNDIIGDEDHWWNDAIESAGNGSVLGGPYRDTDIHGNLLVFCNDDGTELDGGQINVRYWDNRVSHALCGVSCAPCMKGPGYVFRNLFACLGEEREVAGSAFKMGGGERYSPGLNVILHNTVFGNGGGLRSVGFGRDNPNGGAYVAFSRNNLFAVPRGAVTNTSKDSRNSFDYDLIGSGGARLPPGNEVHAVRKEAVLVDARGGDFRMAKGSPGTDAGCLVPGVNDGFAGNAPDVGAFEFGRDEHAVIPHRPWGMFVKPQDVIVKFVQGGSHAHPGVSVSITVPESAGATWAARPNSPWLRCEPASGSTSDRPQRVTIHVLGKGLELRRYRGAVTFRTDQGLNRTLLVTAMIHGTPAFAVWLEGEDGNVKGGMKKVRDKTASGGTYVHTPIPPARPDGEPRLKPAERGEVSFTFEVPIAGTYYVAGRCIAPRPSGMHDSFFFSMDGSNPAIWDVHADSAGWRWDMLNGRGPKRGTRSTRTDPREFRLSKGTHTLTLGSREPGTRLDRLCVSTNPYPPHDD